MTQFPVVDGCLSIGGDAAASAGRARRPHAFYAYDRVLIAARVAELRAALPAGIELHLRDEGQPMPAVVQLLAGLVDGLPTRPRPAGWVALDTGIDAREIISFASPGKRDAELRAAIAAGITINLPDPSARPERVARIGDELGLPVGRRAREPGLQRLKAAA